MGEQLVKMPCPWWHIFWHRTISISWDYREIACDRCKFVKTIYDKEYFYKKDLK